MYLPSDLELHFVYEMLTAVIFKIIIIWIRESRNKAYPHLEFFTYQTSKTQTKHIVVM